MQPDVQFSFQLREILKIELKVLVRGKNDLSVMTTLNHVMGNTGYVLGIAYSS